MRIPRFALAEHSVLGPDWDNGDHRTVYHQEHTCPYDDWRACELAEAARMVLEIDGLCNVCLGFSPPWDGHDINPPCRGGAKTLLDLALARWEGRTVRMNRGKMVDVEASPNHV